MEVKNKDDGTHIIFNIHEYVYLCKWLKEKIKHLCVRDKLHMSWRCKHPCFLCKWKKVCRDDWKNENE